jgi:hypothetical protein
MPGNWMPTDASHPEEFPPPYALVEQPHWKSAQLWDKAFWARDMGTPRMLFLREWTEEARQRKFWKHRYEIGFPIYNYGLAGYQFWVRVEAQNKVIPRWQERGIWQPEWGKPWPEEIYSGKSPDDVSKLNPCDESAIDQS